MCSLVLTLVQFQYSTDHVETVCDYASATRSTHSTCSSHANGGQYRLCAYGTATSYADSHRPTTQVLGRRQRTDARKAEDAEKRDATGEGGEGPRRERDLQQEVLADAQV